MKRVSQFPRSIRPAPDPLGLYFRPNHNDHNVLSNLIAAGDTNFFGVVLDPAHLGRQVELRDQVLDRSIDLILDPKTQEASAPGRYTDRLGKLPWIGGHCSNLEDFSGTLGMRRMLELAKFSVGEGFTQVIAPTHFLQSTDDPWLMADIDNAIRLRDQLDKHAQQRIPIIYSLAVPYKVFRDAKGRNNLIERLRRVPIDSLWLKVAGLGSDSTSSGIINYIKAAEDFHSLEVPVVGDHIGGMAGLSLLAFGAVGGIAHGITFSERFDTTHWPKPQGKSQFGQERRVYIAAVDMMLKPKQAEELFAASSRAKTLFGCGDKHCCPRGIKDMVGNPARHFMVQRMGHIAELSQIPEQLRPQRFLDRHLRPATDMAVAAERVEWTDERLAERTRKNRDRLDSLRVALGNRVVKTPPVTFSRQPRTRASRGS